MTLLTTDSGRFFIRDVGWVSTKELNGVSLNYCVREGCYKKARIWTPRGNHCSDECADITLEGKGDSSPRPLNRGSALNRRPVMAKKKNEAAETETATEKPAKAARPSQNGVTRPGEGTATGRVWEIADELSKEAGQPAPRADVLKAFEAEGGNPATGATQYGRWRKFHGIVPQRKPKAKAEPEEAEVEDTAEVESTE